jgi:HSP20 family molecular chaperone IbpA
LTTFQPKFDVRETDKAYELHGELAGMNKEDVHVEFSDPQTMVVRGHIERSYTAGTPPAGLIEPSSSVAGTIENNNNATNDEEDKQSTSSGDHAASDKNLKATVEDDDENYNEAKARHPQDDDKNNNAVAKNTNSTSTATSADKAKYWLSERSIGEFSRTFNFPQRVDHDAVTASLKDGVLNITVPKAKRHETRRISIE